MFVGESIKKNVYSWKLDWYKKFDLSRSFNLEKNKYKMFLSYYLEIDERYLPGIIKKEYIVKIHLDKIKLDRDILNVDDKNWRALRLFDFIM